MKEDVDNIKTLCAEVVERAKSGHPGAPLGLSSFMHILYTEFLNLDPDNPKYINRDIIMLSNGHACVIQYVMNFLLGYITLEDLKRFRQLNSITPGHPEKNNSGIEATAGPLGQGVASSVGFGISCRILQKYGFNNKVYCLFGDGCYQEGISQESFSLCSKLGLNNITFIYDYNKVTIDGPTELSMDENVKMRFESLNFEVVEIDDDPEMIRAALRLESTRPKVIILHTKIGKDSEVKGTCKAHGAPLGEDNLKKLKEKLRIPQTDFYVSDHLLKTYEDAKSRMRSYISRNRPEVSESNCKVFDLIKAREAQKTLPIEAFYQNSYVSEDLATRKHFGKCLNSIQTNRILISGAADLTSSISSMVENTTNFDSENFGINSYIRFGIREHSMFGVMNGIAAHGFFTPVAGTFLNFTAYGLGAIRIGCLSHLKAIYILTHDSIKLGEDGPTHQPIEVLATLRAIPNLVTLRPCDGRETRSAMAIAIREDGPVALILSRQKVCDTPFTRDGNRKYCENDGEGEIVAEVEKGAYYLHREKNHEIILIATGSEVELAFKVKDYLKNHRISVVSMISFELFERQPESYRKQIIDRSVPKISIEAMTTFGWSKYSDMQMGLDEFGRSAPGEHVYEFFGFTPSYIGEKILEYINK